MPVWPKSFHTFGLSLKTAATEWKLRRKRAAAVGQERTRRHLLGRLATTEHWRNAGLQPKMSYAEFQSRVPLQTYASLAPAIERMRGGEPNVLWPGVCALFGLSSGTTKGEAKYIPATENLLEHFRRGVRDALLYYTVRARHAGIFRGRHLLLGSSSKLATLGGTAGHQAYAAELSGILPLVLPDWAEKHLYEPGSTIAQAADWDALVDGIVGRTCRCDVTVIAGVPKWVAQFATELYARYAQSGQPIRDLQQIWPNLEVFVHSGATIAPFAAELHALLGPAVKFHETYVATEAFVATQDTDAPAAGLRLMADLGVFFEFLPLSEFDDARVSQLGAKAVSLDAAQPGVDYALIVTTPGGLVRYVMEDVVRFITTAPPRLIHRGRTTLRLHAFGENVLEREIVEALVAVCSRNQWSIVNFHVAPLLTNNLTGQQRGRHEWWVELKAGTISTPTGPQIAGGLDGELQRCNPDYAAKRKAGILDVPFVRLVMPGVFEHWQRYQQRWGAQHRFGRCRNDRSIADDLAQITNFARD